MDKRHSVYPLFGVAILILSILACNLPFTAKAPATSSETIPPAVFTEVHATLNAYQNARLTATMQGTSVAPITPEVAQMTVIAQMTQTPPPPTGTSAPAATQAAPAATVQPTVTPTPTIGVSPEPTLAAPPVAGGVPTVVPIFPPTVVPTYLSVPTVVPTFVSVPTVVPTYLSAPPIASLPGTVPTVVPTLISVPTVVPTYLTVPSVQPTFISVPTVMPTLLSVPTVLPTPVVIPSVIPTQVTVPTVIPTSPFVPTVLPTYVTAMPATATPPVSSTAGFRVDNINLNWCSGIPWAVFTIYNASGEDFESAQIHLRDASTDQGLYGPTASNTPFMASDRSCSTGGDSFPAGSTRYLGGPMGSSLLKGHVIRATLYLCTKENLGGKCYQKVVEFIIP